MDFISDVVDDWCERHGFPASADNHFHICEFDLHTAMFDWCSGNKKWAAKHSEKLNQQCREYLANQGLKRDKDLFCCDVCKHALMVNVYGDANVYLIQPQTGKESQERIKRFSKLFPDRFKEIEELSEHR